MIKSILSSVKAIFTTSKDDKKSRELPLNTSIETVGNLSSFPLPESDSQKGINQIERKDEWKLVREDAPVGLPFFQKNRLDMSCGIKRDQEGNMILPLYGKDFNIKRVEVLTEEGKPASDLMEGDFFVIGDDAPLFAVPDLQSACVILQETGKSSVVYFRVSNIRAIHAMFPSSTIVTKGKGIEISKGIGASFIDLGTLDGINILAEAYIQGLDVFEILGLDSSEKLRFHPLWSLMKKFKTPGWIIENFIPEPPSLVELFAPSGVGKTFFVLDIFLTIASGLGSWHGFKAVKGRCLYLCGEGFNAVMLRVICWLQQHNFTHNTHDVDFWLEEGGIDLDNPETIERFVTEFERRYPITKPLIIALDTLNLFMAGDENSTLQASAFVKILKQLALKYKCCILIVHHTGVNTEFRSRGNSAFKGALDSEIRISKSDEDTLVFEQTKNRMAKEQDPVYFKMIEHPLLGIFNPATGEPLSNCTLERIDTPETSNIAFKEKNQDVITLIDAFKQSNDDVSEELMLSRKQLESFAKDRWCDKDSAEISRQINPNQVTRWLGRLIKKNIVEVLSDGGCKVINDTVADEIRQAIADEVPKSL